MTHDCESELLSSAKLRDFSEEWTDFTLLGAGNSTSAKARKGRRQSGSGTGSGGGGSKLVDVTQLRTKFMVKITNVAKTAKTHLNEVLAFYGKYCDEEKDLLNNFKCFSFIRLELTFQLVL